MEKKFVIGIIFIIIMVMFSVPNNVKAEENEYSFEEWCNDNGYLTQKSTIQTDSVYPFTLDDGLNYLFIQYNNENSSNYGRITLIKYDSFFYWHTYGNDLLLYNPSKGQKVCKFAVYRYDDTGWYLVSYNEINMFAQSNYTYSTGANEYIIHYSNSDIYENYWKEGIYYNKTIRPIQEDNLNTTLKLESINNKQFRYNGITYKWTDEVIKYIEDNNLIDYLVFYDDYNKKLDFIWAFDDIFAEAYMKKTGLRWYEYYLQIITESNNTSVLPYIITSYQIENDGSLSYIEELKYYDAEENHLFSYGWNNADYEPHMDDFSTFSTYQEYVLNNNLVASNCDVYNNSGVLIKTAVELNNSLITPDEEPETEIGSLKHYLYEKLPIIGTVEVFIKKFNVVLESMKESGDPPEIIMNFDDYYGFGGQVNVLDVSWYEDYRESVKAILSAILIIPFILWVYKKGLPEAIGGI